MTKKNNKTCIVCGEKYTFCPTCADVKDLEMWKNIYCSENCKKLFHAASGYHAKTATIEEVRTRFDACDLSYKDKLNDNFIEAINAAYGIKEKVEIKEEVKEEIIASVDVESKSEVKEEEKVEVVEKIKYSKPNKKKVVFE